MNICLYQKCFEKIKIFIVTIQNDPIFIKNGIFSIFFDNNSKNSSIYPSKRKKFKKIHEKIKKFEINTLKMKF